MENHAPKREVSFCGGRIETEEETQLRNHLKWARIKVQGAESRTPKEVTVLNAGISYSVQLWTETMARYSVGEERRKTLLPNRLRRSTQRLIQGQVEMSVRNHVGSQQTF